MPALVNFGGDDDLCLRGGPLLSNLMDPTLFLSLAPSVDFCCPPRKRSRITAPPFLFHNEGGAAVDSLHAHNHKQQQQLLKPPVSIDCLPDECLFEVLRRLPGIPERCASACVSKRWLMLLSNIRLSEISMQSHINNNSEEKGEESNNSSNNNNKNKKPSSNGKHLPDLNAADDESAADDDEAKSAAYLPRILEGKDATDVRLTAMVVSAAASGGLTKISIRGSNPTRGITDAGLSAIARGCPSLQVLSMRNVPLVTDEGLSQIAGECPMLEKLDLCNCPLISDKGLIAVADKCPNLTSLAIRCCSKIGNVGLQAIGRCCSKLQSVSLRDCVFVGDQGIAGLVSATATSLKRMDLQNLNISDLALAIVGYYGRSLTELVLTGLQNVAERGFWVMGNALGLQKLRSLIVTSCRGVTDVGLQAIAKGCPSLKQLCVRRCCYLSDAGLKSFIGIARALESLQLEECNRITLIGVLAVLLGCSYKFETLSLVKCLGIRDIASCQVLHRTCISLRSLTIRDCPGFTGSSMAVVGKLCPNLQQLDLSGLAEMTDAGLLPLIEVSELGLNEVVLSGCVNLTDSIISSLVKAQGDTLELLNVDGCRKLTDESLLAVSESCTLLGELYMSRCSITDYGVAVLASARQLNLRALSLSGCAKVTQKSLPFLGNMGQSLASLNLQQCNLITTYGICALEEKLWWCDILS